MLGLRVLLFGAGALPWVLALLRARSAPILRAFSTLCHQDPLRTLSVLDEPMVVCSRCAGLYAGVALGALLPLPDRWRRHGRAVLAVPLALMALDSLTASLGLHPPWHTTRLLTGSLVGWSAAASLTAALLREARGRAERR